MNRDYITKQIKLIDCHIAQSAVVEDALWRIASNADLFSTFDQDNLGSQLTDPQRDVVEQFVQQFKAGPL